MGEGQWIHVLEFGRFHAAIFIGTWTEDDSAFGSAAVN